MTGIVGEVVEGAAETAVGGAATESVLPWVILALVVTVIGLCIGSYAYGHHVEGLVLAKYQSDQKAAAEQMKANNAAALLDQQTKQQAAIDKINSDHTGAINDITKRRDTLVAANRSLTQRLYVATASAIAGPAVFQTGSAGPVDNATGTAALSIGSSVFFDNEFADADKLAVTLTAAQKVIANALLLCNGKLPGEVAAK